MVCQHRHPLPTPQNKEPVPQVIETGCKPVLFSFPRVSLLTQSLKRVSKQFLFFAITVYSALMAILFSCFLIYDTQQIMGGKKYSISPEEHVFAAIQVQLFI